MTDDGATACYSVAPPRSPKIRIVAVILFVTLLAVGLALAGYGALWSLQRQAPPLAEPRPMPESTGDLPKPQRLAAHEDRAAAVPEAAKRPLVAPVELVVVVTGVPAELRSQLGIASFRRLGGGNFVWTPLAAAEGLPDGTLQVATQAEAGDELTLALAASPGLARRSYLASSTAEAKADCQVRLDVTLAPVTFELPESPANEACRGPWRLVRIDDPDWLPMQLSSTGLFLGGDSRVTLLLGGGSYRLQDPLDPARGQEFAVPGPTTVVLNPDLATPRVARQ